MLPEMKGEVGIGSVINETRFIYFTATSDALSEIEKGNFGLIIDGRAGEKLLIVDPRFEIDEVASYLRNYGSPSQNESNS